jgi:hypothetical protein
MTRLSATTVSFSNGDITIDAEALAPKLGLTVRALKENMAKGLVLSVAETGEGEDAGRTRLTFRYRARVWRVVIEADGSLFEDPLLVANAKPANDPFGLFGFAKGAS